MEANARFCSTILLVLVWRNTPERPVKLECGVLKILVWKAVIVWTFLLDTSVRISTTTTLIHLYQTVIIIHF